MRCKYCGSTSLHADKQHKAFSTGKAVAGAVVFGPVGAAAGLAGKEQSGYRCGACGAFMDAPMYLVTESAIDRAISDAEAGRNISQFRYYQKQYPNIQAEIPAQAASEIQQTAYSLENRAETVEKSNDNDIITVKWSYRNLSWIVDWPVYVEKITIYTSGSSDILSLTAWNQSKSILRSVYFHVMVYDDTGDIIGDCRCVYQNLSVAPGEHLPIEEKFPLQTDIAYRVDLICEKAALEDDTVWRAADASDNIILSLQPKLQDIGFPRLKYVLEDLHNVSSIKKNDDLFLPVEKEEYWQCICGQPVLAGHSCPRCGATMEKLNDLLSQERLQKLQQSNVKAIAAKRASVTQELYRQSIERVMDSKYCQAKELQNQDTESTLLQAISIYETLSGYKDSTQQMNACRKRIPILQEKLKEKEIARMKGEQRLKLLRVQAEQEERDRVITAQKKRKKRRLIFSSTIALVMATIFIVTKFVIPSIQYRVAEKLLLEKNYEAAAIEFEKLGNYQDAQKRAQDAKRQANDVRYQAAEKLFLEKNYRAAAIAFGKLGNYRDAQKRAIDIWNIITMRETLSAGDDYYTVGIKTDGKVVATGRSGVFLSFDISSNVFRWSDIVAVSVGEDHVVGIRTDGTVVASGKNDDGQCNVSDWSNIVVVSTDFNHTVGLKADGTVVATGENDDGQCNVSNWSDIVAVSVSSTHTVGLKADGTVVATGKNNEGQCDVSNWSDIVAVSVSSTHTVGLKADGTVVATGYNYRGRCNVSNWSDIVAVSVSFTHTVGLKADGTVVATGYNHDGQCDVSDWNNIVAVSTSYSQTVGLKTDGTVVVAGENYLGQYDMYNWSDIVAVSAGRKHMVGLKADGTVVAVGDNKYGQRDVSKWKNIKTPEVNTQ